MHMTATGPRTFALMVLSALAIGLTGCSSKVTDEDLKMWTNNEEGLRKIEDIVKDTERPMEDRVRALKATLESGASGRIRGFIEHSKDRDTLAQAFRDEMFKLMKSESQAVSAKDGLFLVLPYLPEEQRGAVQKTVAEWAFEGLDDESPTAKLKEQIEHRILVGQIEDLGTYGARGAALLLSRGFAVDRMFRYLVGLGTPEARQLALAAVMRLHQIPDIQVTYAHLERIQEIKSPEAALYLFRIYETEADHDIAADAFNRALALLEAPEVRAQADKVLPEMFKLLKGKSADDRWFAARTILDLGGSAHLGEVLDAFKDDKVYDAGEFDPQKSIIDFCELGVAKLPTPPVPALLERLKSDNRIAQSIAIVCLKTLAPEGAEAALAPLVTSETSLDDFLGDKLTLGTLAQNAIDGLGLMRAAKKELGEQKISDEQWRKRRWNALVVLAKTGDALQQEIDKRIAAENEESAPKAEGGDTPPAEDEPK